MILNQDRNAIGIALGSGAIGVLRDRQDSYGHEHKYRDGDRRRTALHCVQHAAYWQQTADWLLTSFRL